LEAEMKKSDALWSLLDEPEVAGVAKKRTNAAGIGPVSPTNRTNKPDEQVSSFNDTLFPAPAPIVPPTTNLTATEVAERAAAQHARFREAARKWHQFSAVADTTSAAAKALDERIAKGVAFCDRQALAVQAARGDTAKAVEADALLQEGQRQLAKLRDQRQRLAENLAAVEADMDREAAAMGDAEDAIRRALGDGAKGMCCSRCCGWVVDASAHWQVCK
jgi:hypothetical protein